MGEGGGSTKKKKTTTLLGKEEVHESLARFFTFP